MNGPVYENRRYTRADAEAAGAAGDQARRAERAIRRAQGSEKVLGIGVASYVEVTAGRGGTEFGAVEVHDDGTATMYAGTLSHGQGHQTAYAMLVSDQTGIPVDKITLVDGDTDRVRTGGGTGGSRSLQLGGSAVHGATEVMVDKAKELAAKLLEADAADPAFRATVDLILHWKAAVMDRWAPRGRMLRTKIRAIADARAMACPVSSVYGPASAVVPAGSPF